MNIFELNKAINHIRPAAEYQIVDNKVIWLDKLQEEPNEAEIKAGYAAYLKKVENDEVQAKNKKLAAEAKLVALGLTADDLKALGLA